MSFTKLVIEGTKANPDKVYYNATIVNNNTLTTQAKDDPNIVFADTRQTPIVLDASQYQVSVENFSMNGATKTLPIFIPQIADPFNDVNVTVYTLTLAVHFNASYSISTQAIVWEPEVFTSFTNTPQTGQTTTQIESDYYYCYSYTHWVNLCNNALRAAWVSIGGGNDFGTQCPFFEFNETTGLFTLNEDANTSMCPVGTALPPPFSVIATPGGLYQNGEYSFVGMNANLEGLLTNFSTDYFATGVFWQVSGQFLPEVVFDLGLTNLSTMVTVTGDASVGMALKNKSVTTSFLINPFTQLNITDSPFVALTQDFSSTGSLWSPIASFVLATTTIPVRNEAMANPLALGQNNLGTNTANSGSFQKVIIETPINAVTADIWRGWILYEPLTPTYSSLDTSREGLTEIDLYVYWRNRLTNSLIPLRMYNSGTMSFRLLFEKKKSV